MAESSEAQKFPTGLGIVVSVIAVLAFFGITNFDDLKNAGASDRSEACSTAIAARDAEEIVPADELPAKMEPVRPAAA
ncbi:hypothetical protein [Streptomyces sp. NBC_01751]|uniref:hypothetical protein n=1 Tax=Streptomyces sp. NBC_01751 TaxID=2975929 RepID=UPI002DDA2443|nr:hypothetical protein [Streptomyces sp. NBC_01751]WSD29247.1 hypothetical protein OHA26_40790 [Streptomyces sp. NBC_01751]